jgi:dTDP-4-amino-4,6-dideoxygalactose transaminase
MKPIGGEIELNFNLINPAINQNEYLFKYDFTMNGRSAIKLALQTFNCKKIFLLPSYLCDSIIQPFNELSIPFKFYRINDDLSIDLNYLSYCKKKYDVGGILTINYFGMVYDEETLSFLRNLKKDTWIIEDYTHGSLIESEESIKRSIGHIVISSLRKYLPVPDGCIIINNSSFELPKIEEGVNEFSRLRTIAKLLRWEFINSKLNHSAKDIETLFLNLFSIAENSINNAISIEKISYLSEIVLSSLNLQIIRDSRRENFLKLLALFSGSSVLQRFATPIYNSLGDSSPFCFPLRILNGNRDTLRSRLASNNLFCSVLWPLPPGIDKAKFSSSSSLSREILCIPIDQRYNINDMEDIGERFHVLFK